MSSNNLFAYTYDGLSTAVAKPSRQSVDDAPPCQSRDNGRCRHTARCVKQGLACLAFLAYARGLPEFIVAGFSSDEPSAALLDKANRANVINGGISRALSAAKAIATLGTK